MNAYSRIIALIQDVGCNCAAFTWDNLCRMPAAQFLNIIAPNMRIKVSSWHPKKNNEENE